MKPMLRIDAVAQILGKSERFVLDEVRRKNLAGSKYGGAWHFAEEDVESYVEAHRNVARVRKSA